MGWNSTWPLRPYFEKFHMSSCVTNHFTVLLHFFWDLICLLQELHTTKTHVIWLRLARTVYIHRIWPCFCSVFGDFPAKKYRIYTVYMWFWLDSVQWFVRSSTWVPGNRVYATAELAHVPSLATVKLHTTKTHVIWCSGLSDPAHGCLENRVYATAELAYVPSLATAKLNCFGHHLEPGLTVAKFKVIYGAQKCIPNDPTCHFCFVLGIACY